MKRTASTRILVGIGAVLVSVSISRAETPGMSGPRIFICGHSFHMPVANMLPEIVKSAAIDQPALRQQRIGGSSVQQHWDLPDDQNTLKQALRAGEVDVLTLSPTAKLPDEGIDKFTALALEHNSHVRILVQASWAGFDSPNTNPRTFKNSQRDAAQPDELRKGYDPFYKIMRDQVRRLNDKFQGTKTEPVVLVVPVAYAVIALREQVAAGKVPGIAKQSELFRDDRGHGTPPVYLLATYCNYAVVYRRSPVGLPVPSVLAGRSQVDSEKLNRLLQQLAWDAVKNEPLAGIKD